VTGNGGGLLARVRVIEPEDDFSDMLEFDPAKIARGILVMINVSHAYHSILLLEASLSEVTSNH
jgi:hypothetical protein